MEIKILEEKDNLFFKRKDLKLEIKHTGAPTPKKQDLIKELATKYKKPEENIIVNYIFTKKGIQKSEARAKVYEEKPPEIKTKEVEPEEKKEEVKPEEKPKKVKEKKEEKPKTKIEKEGEKTEAQTGEKK